jgi:hypothetical protein
VIVHAQYRSATTDIQDDLVFENVRVVVDGITVGLGSDLIFLDPHQSVRRCGNHCTVGFRTNISS